MTQTMHAWLFEEIINWLAQYKGNSLSRIFSNMITKYDLNVF